MSNASIGQDDLTHYADDFHDSYRGEYRCPDEKCGVKMILKNLGSDEKPSGMLNPYFSSTSMFPHVEGCNYENGSISYSQLLMANFKATDFFSKLFQSGRKQPHSSDTHSHIHVRASGKRSITTIGELYHYCLQHSDDHELPDGTKIYEIYQEKRNEAIRERDRRMTRLIKLNFKNCNLNAYDEIKRCYKIWCYYPHTENSVPPATYYTLGFEKENLDLMCELCERLTPLKTREGSVHIVVGGEWKNHHCDIKSKRQIFIVSEKHASIPKTE